MSKISQELISYRNFYWLYLDAAELLMKIPCCEVVAFLLIKRGLQLSSLLFYYIKSEAMPNKSFVTLTCTPQEWAIFIKSARFPNFLTKVLEDIVTLRDLFEKQFSKTLALTNKINIEYEKFINDDLNKSLTSLVYDVCKFTANRLYQDLQNGANIEMRVILYIILIRSYEKNGSSIPFYKTIGQFLDGVWKKDDASI